MSTQTIEERLSAVETKLEQLQREKQKDNTVPWWERIRGQFKDDPAYEEAMRLGRKWRESEDEREKQEDEREKQNEST